MFDYFFSFHVFTSVSLSACLTLAVQIILVPFCQKWITETLVIQAITGWQKSLFTWALQKTLVAFTPKVSVQQSLHYSGRVPEAVHTPTLVLVNSSCTRSCPSAYTLLLNLLTYKSNWLNHTPNYVTYTNFLCPVDVTYINCSLPLRPHVHQFFSVLKTLHIEFHYARKR